MKLKLIENIVKFSFIGISIILVAILFFMAVHDVFTRSTYQIAGYCAKYGFLASPECW